MSSDGSDHGGTAGAPRAENPFASPSSRPAPPPRAYPGDYPAAPYPDAAPSPYATDPQTPRGGFPPSPVLSQDDGGVVFPGSEHVDPGAVLAGPGYTAGVVRNDPLAVAALVLGVLAAVPGVGLAAVVCGHLALRRAETGYSGGRGLAVAGLVLGYALTGLWALLLLAVWGVRDML